MRVILGSTATLGTGVNIQRRLHMAIHMDAPDRPMDYTQRNGRILRQGNLHKDWNKTVRVLRFGVEDSLDVTSYQRLKTKAAFIDSVMDSKPLLSNAMENRILEEEEEGLFDNPVARLSGSQYAQLKSQAERELRKYQNKQKQYQQDQIYIENQLRGNKAREEQDKRYIEDYRASVKRAGDVFAGGKVKTVTVAGVRCKTDEEIKAAIAEKINKQVGIARESARTSWGWDPKDLHYSLEFDGVKVNVKVTVSRREASYLNGDTKPSSQVAISYTCPELFGNSIFHAQPKDGIMGIVDRFRNDFATGKYQQAAIAGFEADIERMASDNALMLQRRGVPFAETDKLAEAKAKVAEYTAKMKEEMAEKEKKYAEAQAAETDLDVNNIEVEDEDSEGGELQIADEELGIENDEQQLAFDTVSQMLSDAGIEVEQLSDEAMTQMAERMEEKEKALEIVSSQNGYQQTVISSASGAKILKNLDTLHDSLINAEKAEVKTFLGRLAQALGAKKHGSNSQYASFVTKSGKPITIRLANHNASVSTFDNHEESEGISIVVSAKKNSGLDNNGKAHLVEFYYDAIKLRKAEGKPLADIVSSIKQALYSGEYKDATGLAEVEEVNAENIPQFMTVYHGSGAKFDAFDSSHMGEGEGAQAYGWGHYVTEVEGIGRTYAAAGSTHNLYTVEIPEDNGSNYFEWNKKVGPEEGMAFLNRLKALAKEDGLDTESSMWARLESDIQRHPTSSYRYIKGQVQFIYGAELGLSSDAEENKKGSELLSRLGYIGIKYPADYQNGGRVDGAMNYVVFKDSDLKIIDRIEFLRDGDVVYGAAVGGKIYLNAEHLNPNTPIHEYTHLWDKVCKAKNPELWKRGVELMKQTSLWEEVKRDPNYKGLNDEGIASEVHSRLTGEHGAELLERLSREAMEANGGVFEKAGKVSVIEELKHWLSSFWHWVKDTMTPWSREEADKVSLEDFINMPLADLAKGTRVADIIDGEDGYVIFSIVNDKKEIDRLNSEPTIKTYRAMQLHDGVLYPPMAGKVNGKWQQGIAVEDLGEVWEKSDEHPELADNKGHFKLDKGNGKSLKARYNPYFHTSLTPLNDQFAEAQDRPELVTVEVEVPESELTSGYKAEKAKDSVGKVKWPAGAIQKKLTGTRTVILSRWDKPVRIVPDSEVADVIVKMFGGKDITMPSNVVTPQLRSELEKRGIPFVDTDNQGKPVENGNEIEQFNERFNEELQKQIEGTLPKGHIYRLGNPSSILLATKVPNLPIEMPASRLEEKSSKYGHDFELEEVRDLVKALQRPLAVFSYGDKTKAQNVIVPIRKNGKNFIVGLFLNPIVGGQRLEINSVRNIFPKDNAEWLNWITQDKALYLDKAKIQTLIDQQRTNLADVEYLDLDSVTNLVKNFVNPKQSAENESAKFRGPVGGNSGYVGYSMSKRAAEAREEGRFPKGDFCKEYGVSRAHFDTLVKAGVIDNSEWHHTSIYGNRTEFYEWSEPEYREMYEEHKREIGQIISGGKQPAKSCKR